MSAAPFESASAVADRRRSLLAIIDVQEKLVPAIQRSERLLQRIDFLMNVCNALALPVVVTEQYPKGLGPTVPSIAQHEAVDQVLEKLKFSADECLIGSEAGQKIKREADPLKLRPQVILVGIETHICVLQTALLMRSQGWEVFVPHFAVSSRHADDHQNGLQRLSRAGVVVCNCESLAFEWCQTAATSEFKAVSQLVRSEFS